MTDELHQPSNDNMPLLPQMNGVRWIALAIPLLLTIFIYARSFHTPFILDDEVDIQMNSSLRLENLSLSELKRAAFNERCANRPVANITFALNLLAHGENVWGFHLVNLAIHLTTGVLLFLLVWQTLRLNRTREPDQGEARDFAFAAAAMAMLLWMVHPLQTQTVTYIVQRMNGLSAMFYLLCLWLYVNGRLSAGRKRKALFFGAAILSGVMALGSKENAAMLPFAFFLYEWLFLQDDPARFIKQALPWAAGAMAVTGIVGYIYWISHPLTAKGLMQGYAMRDFTMGQRLLTEPRVVIFYIGLLLLPWPGRLNLDYDYPLSTGLFHPATTWIALTALVALICLAMHAARRDRLLTLAVLWYLGNLVIESTFIPLEIIFEHRLYLPSMMPVALFVVWAVNRLKSIRVTVALATLIALLLSGVTYIRNGVWQDEIRLWEDAASKAPGKARPYINLAKTMIEKRRPEAAIAYAQKAVTLDPESKEAHINLGIAYMALNNIPEALRHTREAVRLDPDYATAQLNLGDALALQGSLDEAVEHYRQALRLSPFDAPVHNNLGQTLARQGLREEAVRHFREALKLMPDYPEVHFNLGIAAWEDKRPDEAIAYFKKAGKLGISNPDVYYQMANVYYRMDRLEEAETSYRKAIELNPQKAEAHERLANVLIRRDRWEDAIALLREVLKLDPANADAHHNLGAALARKNQLGEAIRHFTTALELDPSLTQARENLGKALAAQRSKFGESSSSEDRLDYVTGILTLRPDDVDARNSLGNILAAMGRRDEALTQYRKALEISPDSPESHFNLANALAAAGAFDEAVEHYQDALRLKADYIEARQNLGVAYTRMNRLDLAAEEFTTILKAWPKKQDVIFNLGSVEQGRGRLEESARTFKKLLDLDPDHAEGRFQLANTLAAQGKLVEAEGEYRKLIASHPDHALAHYDLGNILALRQRFKEAEVAFMEALRLQPDFKDAQRNLKHVRGVLQEMQTIDKQDVQTQAPSDQDESAADKGADIKTE